MPAPDCTPPRPQSTTAAMFSQPYNRYFKRPDGYANPRRSPTPPRAFVEPLSPPSSTKPQALEPSFNYPAINDNISFTVHPQPLPPQHAYNGPSRVRTQSDSLYQKRGHQRVPSTIDTLAEAALAVSPAFATPAPPRRPQNSGHSHVHPPSSHHTGAEPPHKRSRSELLPSPLVGQYASRPATSYEASAWPQNSYSHSQASYERRVEDAALLLNFRTGGWPSASSSNIPLAPPAAPPSVRPHANSFPRAIYHQRPATEGSYASQAPLLPPFHSTQRSTQHAAPPAWPSPEQTSEGNAASPKDGIDKAVDEIPMLDAPSAPIPQQTHTPPVESVSRAASSDVTMIEASEPTKQRGWPKGKPRAGASKPKVQKVGKRASKNAAKAAKARNVFAEAALEAQQPQQRRNSFAASIVDALDQNPAIARAQSVPAEVPMVVRGVAFAKPTRKQNKVTPDTVCAGCNSSRESANPGGELDEWISCNGCEKWFHVDCAGFKKALEVRDVDKYFCIGCESKHGKTTYVRKSTRAHTSVDYAELQKGVLKTSEESAEHHYIQPIKDGTFTFDPETFPRMRPELVTREFLERSGAFIEPICIPAEWNPRPWELRERAKETGATDQVSISAHTSDVDMVDTEEFEYDTIQDDGQDKLDMVMPEGLTVRQVCNIVGGDTPLDVIDVKTQNSGSKWNLKKWADYYEEESDDKQIRNVISLEVSQTKLGRLLRRPKVVRDIDLQDEVWPQEEKDKGKFPKVQFYCLMSIADSYTDFHIDFGGSSVYYHILRGKKTFFFIPPKAKHLKAYEEWNESPQQNFTFLPHTTKECYRVDLFPGDTMLIPSGWIHAVWTPETSLVIGGNFLNRLSYKNQFKVHDIEKNNETPQKFRYPHFQRIMWYTAIRYLKDDPLPQAVSQDFYEGRQFVRERPVWVDYDGDLATSDTREGAQNMRYYSQAEVDGLPELVNFIFRTVMLVMGRIEGISQDKMKRVNASIPKGHGEPLEVAKTFALWVAWKRGNEDPPAWAHPDAVLPNSKEEGAAKKLSARALKDMERKEAMAAWRVAGPDRQSRRVIAKKSARTTERGPGPGRPASTIITSDSNLNFTKGASATPAKPSTSSTPSHTLQSPPPRHQSPAYTSSQPHIQDAMMDSTMLMDSSYPGQFLSTPKTSVLGPKRVACDTCRKRRIRCKHKDLVVQGPPLVSFEQPYLNNGDPNNFFFGQSQVGSEVGDSIVVAPPQFDETQAPLYQNAFGDQNTNDFHQSTSTNGVMSNGAHTNGKLHLEVTTPSADAYANSNLPMNMNGVSMFGDASKRGRSKACIECRKSKVSVPCSVDHSHLVHTLMATSEEMHSR
jgi:F-box/leucine-rich repeat protein 10/11